MTSNVLPFTDHSTARFAMRSWGEFSLFDHIAQLECTPRGRKACAVIAYLSVLGGERINRERLTGMLWSERGEEQARASLRQTLFELKSLGRGSPALLETDRSHVRLNPTLLSSDGSIFEAHAQRGDLGGMCQTLANRGGELFSGLDGLDPAFDEWLALQRRQELDRVISHGIAAGERGLEEGKAGQVRELAASLQALDLTHENVAQLGMLADHASGNHAAIHRRYQQLRDDMARDLDVEPSAETQAMLRRLTEKGKGTEAAVASAVPAANGLALPDTARTKRKGVLRGRIPWRKLAKSAAALALVIGAILGVLQWRFNASNANSVAVMPFRAMQAQDDPYLAEGIAEEVLDRLARNPKLRVMGRSSTWAAYKHGAIDTKAFGRELDVAYLVEGRVQKSASGVAVSVSLLKTMDGTQVWSEKFSSSSADAPQLQDRIAEAVAEKLAVRKPALAFFHLPVAKPRGDAYVLYATARGLLHDREIAKDEAARKLLQQAVKLDPDFGAAWGALARATILCYCDLSDAAKLKARFEETVGYVKKAVALDPRSADVQMAIGALTMMATQDSGKALGPFQKAVELNPSDGNVWFEVAMASQSAGDFQGSLHAYRRALAVDPFNPMIVVMGSIFIDSMGFHDEARGYVQRFSKGNTSENEPAIARTALAHFDQDYSRAILEAKDLVLNSDVGDQPKTKGHLSMELAMIGMAEEVTQLFPMPPVQRDMILGKPVGANFILSKAPLARQFWGAPIFAYPNLRHLLNAGRAAEVVQLYDRTFSSPEDMARNPAGGTIAFLQTVAPTVLALREVGRTGDADRLASLADSKAREILRQGRVPNYFHELTAQIHAVNGDKAASIKSLQRSIAEGWTWSHRETMSLRRISNEPAYRTLRGDPRFIDIDNRIEAMIQRERSELGPFEVPRT